MDSCIFCKLISGEIPTSKLYEDGDMIVIKDIHPRAPIHLLMIPKNHYADITRLDQDTAAQLSRCFLKLNELQEQFGIENGFRLIINKGARAGQSVFHLHIHILSGQEFSDF